MPVGRGLVHRGAQASEPPGLGNQGLYGRGFGVHQEPGVGEGDGPQVDLDGLAQLGVRPLGRAQPQGDGLLDLAVLGHQHPEPLLGQLPVGVDHRLDRAAEQAFGLLPVAALACLVGLVDRGRDGDQGLRQLRGQRGQVHQLPGPGPRPGVLAAGRAGPGAAG